MKPLGQGASPQHPEAAVASMLGSQGNQSRGDGLVAQRVLFNLFAPSALVVKAGDLHCRSSKLLLQLRAQHHPLMRAAACDLPQVPEV